MMVKVWVLRDFSITFLEIREFVLRWVGEDRLVMQDVDMQARVTQLRTRDSNAGAE